MREDGQPYLIDLGEIERMGETAEDIEFGIASDLATFRRFAEQYVSSMSRKERRALENLNYRDYLIHR